MAHLAVAIDTSGSMLFPYWDGTIQDFLERAVAFSHKFTNKDRLDLWLYASKTLHLYPISHNDLPNLAKDCWNKKDELGCKGDEAQVIEQITAHLSSLSHSAEVLFLSGGGIYKDKPIVQALCKAERWPIYWHFLALGRDHGPLSQLNKYNLQNADFKELKKCLLYSADFAVN